MNIVLVCLFNLQEYIFDNIKHLVKLNHENIYVIVTENIKNYFLNYDNIKIIIADNLFNPQSFFKNTSLDTNFRNGFWAFTSLRFFYINEFMKKYNIEDVIHLENDVLIYYNCNNIINLFDKNYLYIPFDSYKRNICSIMYIPSTNIFTKILYYYNPNKNDMENFVQIKQKTNLICNLPIFPNINISHCNNEIKFLTNNYNIFGYIFDAAAMGQYLGGVDPRNIEGNTIGFVNEECIIKYNNYKFIWKIIDNMKKPFLKIGENEIPIFNLHIHSKKLSEFNYTRP